MAEGAKRGFLRSVIGLGPRALRGDPVAAAQLLDAGGHAAAGMIASIAAALHKPIYSDVTVTTKTWTTSDGRVITEQHTKGWSIPLGLPVLIVGAIALWEIGLALAKAFGVGKGGNSSDFADAAALLNPGAWLTYEVATGQAGGTAGGTSEDVAAGLVFGFPGLLAAIYGQKASAAASSGSSGSPGTTSVKLPSSFMAAMSYTGIVGMAPLIAGMNRLMGIGPPKQ